MSKLCCLLIMCLGREENQVSLVLNEQHSLGALVYRCWGLLPLAAQLESCPQSAAGPWPETSSWPASSVLKARGMALRVSELRHIITPGRREEERSEEGSSCPGINVLGTQEAPVLGSVQWLEDHEVGRAVKEVSE